MAIMEWTKVYIFMWNYIYFMKSLHGVIRMSHYRYFNYIYKSLSAAYEWFMNVSWIHVFYSIRWILIKFSFSGNKQNKTSIIKLCLKFILSNYDISMKLHILICSSKLLLNSIIVSWTKFSLVFSNYSNILWRGNNTRNIDVEEEFLWGSLTFLSRQHGKIR